MKEYTTTAVINAPAVKVWEILTDAPGYASWNPEIMGVEGRFALGERIKARVRVKAGGGKMAIRSVPLRITVFEPPTRMEWKGGMPLGLFKGKRILTVTPRGTGVEFRMDLKMSGPMLGMILKSIGDRQPEIDSFSAGLKARAEGP
jgi:uncharacterized protein YndB with AHSA1/START domain